MRSLTKGFEPKKLQDWRRENPNETNWSTLPGEVKQEIRESLCRDQGNLCAFCERRIRPERKAADREHMRIAHGVPRQGPSGVPEKTFDWQNLLGSCPDSYHPTKTCDVAQADRPLCASPYSTLQLEAKLQFKRDGSIETLNVDLARDLETLNLNADRLKMSRQDALRAFTHSVSAKLGKEATWKRSSLEGIRTRAQDPRLADLEVHHTFLLFHLNRWIHRHP